MTSKERRSADVSRIYVWAWLPGAVDPVVAGVLQATGDALDREPVLAFRYAASYRARPEAISLFTPELPLSDATFDPRATVHRDPLALAGCLRDAAPDAWGRRVIEAGLHAGDPLPEHTYLLGSGSDRIGALDFQASADDYVARNSEATLDQLLHMAELVEAGDALPDSLLAATAHGTSLGGARPKALLEDTGRHLIAKFSSTTDTRPVVQAEAVAMLLAAKVGLRVPAVEVVNAAGKDVLLVERFDRVTHPDGHGPVTTRRQILSMLTVLGHSEMNQRYASYADIAHHVRTGSWVQVSDTLRELFTRLVFNVFIGNNDDHLRNHAVFWDGRQLELTPAYDLAPQPRSTRTSTQAIGITRDGQRASQLWLCRQAAGEFLLTTAGAQEVIDHVQATLEDHWSEACDQARLPAAQAAHLWGREFSNPYIFDDLP